jgi:hypothetical protein
VWWLRVSMAFSDGRSVVLFSQRAVCLVRVPYGSRVVCAASKRPKTGCFCFGFNVGSELHTAVIFRFARCISSVSFFCLFSIEQAGRCAFHTARERRAQKKNYNRLGGGGSGLHVVSEVRFSVISEFAHCDSGGSFFLPFCN